MSYVARVERAVQDALAAHPQQSVAHRLGHVVRTRRNAMEIAVSYPEADSEILELACLLHDIDQKPDGKEEHVSQSMVAAAIILRDCGCDDGVVQKVVDVIAGHSTEGEDESAANWSPVEARILYDADKLDALGACGIARVFSLCGQRGIAPEDAVPWYEKKIAHAATHLRTPQGVQRATELLPYVEQFLNELKMRTADAMGALSDNEA